MQQRVAWSSISDLLRIFLPDIANERKREEEQPAQLMHYTRIESALKILQSRQLWLRNARKMLDETEIKHGIDLFEKSWNGHEGSSLKRELLAIDADGESAVERVLSADRERIEENTYIACAAMHEPERIDGALPHWERGDVGLAFNRLMLRRAAEESGAGSALVQYRSKIGYQGQFDAWIEVLRENASQLRMLEPGTVGETIARAAMYKAMLIKHPRFENEREWRMFAFHDDTPKRDASLRNEPAVDGWPWEAGGERQGLGWGMQDVSGRKEFVCIFPMKWSRNLLEGIFVRPSENSDVYIGRLNEELGILGLSNVTVTLAEWS